MVSRIFTYSFGNFTNTLSFLYIAGLNTKVYLIIMKLTHSLLACNENTKYLHFWPFVKRAWKQIVGIDVTMVYIGESLPEELEDDNCIILFKPVPRMPTATQAQMIRLLYPALIKTDGAVVIGDMDCMPLNADFFHRGFSDATPDQFVSLKAPI